MRKILDYSFQIKPHIHIYISSHSRYCPGFCVLPHPEIIRALGKGLIIRIPEIVRCKFRKIQCKCHPLHIGIDHRIIPCFFYRVTKYFAVTGKLFFRKPICSRLCILDLFRIKYDRISKCIILHPFEDKPGFLFCLFVVYRL